MKIQQLLSVCENERERYLLHTSGILFAQRAILLRNACDTRLRDRGYYDRDDVHGSSILLTEIYWGFFLFFFFLEGRVDARVAKEKRRGVKEIYGQTLYSSYSFTVFFKERVSYKHIFISFFFNPRKLLYPECQGNKVGKLLVIIFLRKEKVANMGCENCFFIITKFRKNV